MRGRRRCLRGWRSSFSRGSSWCARIDRVEARSIMDLLTLGAAQGTELILEADGDDAQEAVEALAKLVESGFPDEDAEANKQAKRSESSA